MSEIKRATDVLDTAVHHGRKLDAKNCHHCHIYNEARDVVWNSVCEGIKILEDADLYYGNGRFDLFSVERVYELNNLFLPKFPDDYEHFGKFGDTLPAFEDLQNLEGFTIIVVTKESPGSVSKTIILFNVFSSISSSIKLRSHGKF